MTGGNRYFVAVALVLAGVNAAVVGHRGSALAAAVHAAMDGVRDDFPYGVWESTDADKRWKLWFSGTMCVWQERRPGQPQPNRTAVTMVQQGQQWRIERPNDESTLRFLGATPALIPQILERSPAASFMLFDLQDDGIVAHWNGLRWLLKPNGSLDRIEQAGATPATRKDFVLRNTLEGVWGGKMTADGGDSRDITMIALVRGGALTIELYTTPENHGQVENVTVAGKDISFHVPFTDVPMDMTGTMANGSFSMQGRFSSQAANGSWSAKWLKVEEP
jgi:hypothetical protein